MIDFLSQVDEYCERTDFQFLSEPLNFFSNLFFWLAAYLAYGEISKSRARGSGALQGLVVLLFLVGLGSGCFHSFAMIWSKICDVGFIGLFVLWFLWFWSRQALRFSIGRTLLIFYLFFALSTILTIAFRSLPVNKSESYFGVAIFLLIIGWQQAHYLSKSKTLFLAGITFCLALMCRSFDETICKAWPYGTHFLWHSLNALVCYLTIRGLREELETHEMRAFSKIFTQE